MTPPRVLLVGIGNLHRGDDAVGRRMVRRFSKAWKTGEKKFQCLENDGDPAELIEAWQGADVVWVFDAARSGAAPGTLHRIEAHRQTLAPDLFPCSTHALGLAEAVELARTLNRLPPELVIFGIEGRNFGAGAKMSPAVARAAEKLVADLLPLLKTLVRG